MNYPVRTQKYDTLPIALEKALAWLRIPDSYMGDNDLVKDLIVMAADYVETECNISLGISTYEWEADCLPGVIPDTFYVQEISSISGSNASGVNLIIDTDYRLLKTGKRGRKIKWIDGYRHDYTGFTITFTAGFDEEEIPPRILMAIRALIAEWYDNRGNLTQEKKTFVDNLLAPYAIPYVA
ncbi:phage head-tail connector protein [Dyadobacter sp. CY323]|uniref:head-tail connector protein n=1 Tax=Dyadobacter sp. CY323 TaxID=2907302 RepID=UPI001F21BF73|nr:phage head-tail connector protein [Dyadobacter sp. CY323]MCE6992098.1 phage head-tail connector protein [Dyadobacter sp. CY323]